MNNTIKIGPLILYMIINHYINQFIVLANMQWYNTGDVRKHCHNLKIFYNLVFFVFVFVDNTLFSLIRLFMVINIVFVS